MIIKQPTPYNYFTVVPHSSSMASEWYTNMAAEYS